MQAKPQVSVGLSLFGFTIEVHDVFALFGKRSVAGPFVIVERLEGHALETNQRAVNGWQPWLGRLHGGFGQQWQLNRSAHNAEVVITSVANGLALDSTWDEVDEAPLLLWERHNESNQRWSLRRTPDNLAWTVHSAYDGRVLDVGRTPQSGDKPHMWTYHGQRQQQFLLLPIG